MPPDFTPSAPEKEQVSLFLSDSNLELKDFDEYSFSSHFLTPSDGWNLVIGAERLPDEVKAALVPGAKVKLSVNGATQATGYLDSIEVNASRSSGAVWRISGRDGLAQIVSACADPTVSLKDGTTLLDGLIVLFTPFGFSKPEQFVNSNAANLDIKTASARAKTKRSAASGFSRRGLREYKLHLQKPYPKEGLYDFATRMSQRLGLWIWLSADGEHLVVSTPDFDQEPLYKLFRNSDGTTNVLEGSVKFDMTDQPTHIIADSYSAGGEFGRGRCVAIMANTVMSVPEDPDVSKYVNAGAVVYGAHPFPVSSSMKAPRVRIIYIHDDESQTQEQLEAFIRKEMALCQRKSLTVSYTVEGHGQVTPAGFVPWTVDTTVEVRDELSGLSETLYVMGRTFDKSRSGGTTTHLELIRLGTLVFTDDSKKNTSKQKKK